MASRFWPGEALCSGHSRSGTSPRLQGSASENPHTFNRLARVLAVPEVGVPALRDLFRGTGKGESFCRMRHSLSRPRWTWSPDQEPAVEQSTIGGSPLPNASCRLPSPDSIGSAESVESLESIESSSASCLRDSPNRQLDQLTIRRDRCYLTSCPWVSSRAPPRPGGDTSPRS
jgi:hypothetical protein